MTNIAAENIAAGWNFTGREGRKKSYRRGGKRLIYNATSPLVPGIISYVTTDGEERFLALDEGVLIKQGDQVYVSAAGRCPVMIWSIYRIRWKMS